MQLLPLALLTGVSGLVSAVILTLAFQQYLVWTNEGFRNHVQQRASEPLPIRGSAFTAARAANWSRDGSTLSIIEALDGEAVFKTERRLNAEKYAFLRLKIEGLNPSQRLFLFWHTAEQPEGTFYYQLDFGRSHTIHTNLLREDFWKGNVTELVIGVFGDPRGRPITLHEVTLLPMTPWALLSTMVSEWRAFKVWDQTSINVYRGAPARALAYPVPVVTAWCAVTVSIFILALRLLRKTRRIALMRSERIGAINATVLIGWMSLSLIWVDQLLLQNSETLRAFWGKSLHERHLADWDSAYYQLARTVLEASGPRKRDIAIVYTNEALRQPLALRLRYHLMPELTAGYVGRIDQKAKRRIADHYDLLLALGPQDTQPGYIMQELEDTGLYDRQNDQVLLNSPKALLIELAN